jgi:hypothetical protein
VYTCYYYYYYCYCYYYCYTIITTTNTTSILLSNDFILLHSCCLYPQMRVGNLLTLFSHSHIILRKYFPFLNSVTRAQFIVLLRDKSSFILNHMLHANSSIYFFFSEHFNMICLASFSHKHRGHLKFGRN